MVYTTKMIVDRTEKNWRPSIWVYEIRPTVLLGFGAHTYLHALSVILGIYIPYFASSLILLYKIV